MHWLNQRMDSDTYRSKHRALVDEFTRALSLPFLLLPLLFFLTPSAIAQTGFVPSHNPNVMLNGNQSWLNEIKQ